MNPPIQENDPRLPVMHPGRHNAEEWVLGLVRQLVLSIMDERDKRYQERFEAQQEALGKVEEATEKRFESVNEFRAAMTDRDILYMPRSESLAQHVSTLERIENHSREDLVSHEAINKRLDNLSKRVDTFEGNVSGGRTTLLTIGGIATFLVASIVIGTFVFTGRPVPAPQVIYVPAAPGTLVPSTPQPAQR